MKSDEMVARIDDVLAHAAPGDEMLPFTSGSFNRELLEATEIESPIGAQGEHWIQVAEAAWETLTGETELPAWFDELTTVTELARRSGRTPTEVREALDEASGSSKQLIVLGAPIHGSLYMQVDYDTLCEAMEELVAAQRVAGCTAEEIVDSLIVFASAYMGYADEITADD